MKNDGTLTTILSTDGAYTCNTTKGTPCLSADIFGDWREELIVRASDSKSLRIYCTPYETDYRITTLMHDPQYRNQVAGQNISYNQPPHTSFYLASNYKLPERPNVSVLDDGIVIPPSPVFTPAVLTEGAVYMIQNENSGLYMEVKDANAENTANVQQWGAESSAAHNTWRVLSAGNDYYYLYSQLGDKVTYLLDIDMGKSDNGTNIQIYTDTKADAQQFKFVRNDDGTYYILTKSSGDKSCVAVSSASTSSGANIIQWEYKAGDKSQKWILTQVEDTGCIMDTNSIYMFKNLNSGLYMEAEGGKASDNTNVQQWGADGISAHNSWTLKSFGGGYYYVISQLADGKTYYLNISGGTKENGGNAEILTNNKTSSHLFKFVKNPDGSYYILTRASKDAGALETAGGSKGSGANVQQWEVNGESCQKWIVEASEPVYEKGDININKKVDVSDIVIMNKYLVKLEKFSEQQFFLADINDDGKVNVFDYILIRRKVM